MYTYKFRLSFLSRSKIEYMKCELSKMKNKNGVVELDGQEIPKE